MATEESAATRYEIEPCEHFSGAKEAAEKGHFRSQDPESQTSGAKAPLILVQLRHG